MTRARLHATAVVVLTAFWAASGCWPARVSAQTPAGARAQTARPVQEPGAAPASVVVSDQDAAGRAVALAFTIWIVLAPVALYLVLADE